MPPKQVPEIQKVKTATLSALQSKQHLSNEVYDKIAAVHNSSVGHWGQAKCRFKLDDLSVTDRMTPQYVHSAVPVLSGDEPPEDPDKESPLHLCLVPSIRGDSPGPHRSSQTGYTWQHVHPRADRRILSVGRAIPHQDNDGSRVSVMYIPTYWTIQHTRSSSYRPWNCLL